MRMRGMLLATAFVLGLIALAWLTGDNSPFADPKPASATDGP